MIKGYPKITEELKTMYEEDQAMRHGYLKDQDRQEWDENEVHSGSVRHLD